MAGSFVEEGIPGRVEGNASGPRDAEANTLAEANDDKSENEYILVQSLGE